MREVKGATVRKRRPTREQMVKREKGIIEDIKAGKLSYRQIAAKWKVSLPTVNNKARKAGISRGRRKGAKIIVARPVARKAAKKAARKPVRKAARKAVRKTARKATTRRARKTPVTAQPMMMASSTPVLRRGRAGRRTVRRGRTRRVVRARATAGQATAGFSSAFRVLVLKHYPKISLVKFDRLAKLVESHVR